MKHTTAPTSSGVKIVTGAVAGLAGLFLVLSIKFTAMSLVGLLLLLVMLACYLRAPVAYDYSSGVLTVQFRVGSIQFGPVIDCNAFPEELPKTIRVWGNGGVFAGTGIYWNKQWGFFRAYVTTTNPPNLVLVETTSKKVLVSPANVAGFVADLTAGN